MPTQTADKTNSSSAVYAPDYPLSRSIALLWSQESPPDAPPRREISLPEGTVELVLNLADSSEQGMLVCGPHSRPFLAETPQGASLIAVHFRPGGAVPFFDLPLTELQNQIVPLEALWGASARHLRDALLSASPGTRLPLLEDALHTRWRARPHTSVPIAVALRHLNRNPNTRITTLAETLGWSERHLNRVFREQVGLSPRLYGRVRRFQSTLRRIPADAPVPWAELARHSGYFDQAHLVHDFVELAGVTPTEYQRRCDRHRNHLSV